MTNNSWPGDFETLLRQHLSAIPADNPIPPDQSLFELGLDSVGAVTLLTELEDHFDIQFDDEVLDLQLFSGVTYLWQAVRKLS
ncbi:phosphopantetheine-binding protein [Sphaerisporangium sp. NPDC005288]|uniref:phosphopantetheine-binding protein n=1 Tax=Sphaerisporangium sp. NPDC005288 TaxID=3155114 RepID=UPI0033AA5063